MNIIAGNIILFLFCGLMSIESKYQRHIQICSGTFGVDRKWRLSIKKDSSFEYRIETIDTKALKKYHEEKYSGTCGMRGNTLILKPNSANTPPYYFLAKGKKLIPIYQTAKAISGFVVQLDYLEIEKQLN